MNGKSIFGRFAGITWPAGGWLTFVLIVCSAVNGRGEVVTYPAPKEETLSTDYTVEVDGKPVDVYLAKTQWWDKKPYSFAYFDFSGAVTVKIKTSRPLDKLGVLPTKYGIKPTVSNGEATFTTDKTFSISFEPTGGNCPLLLFGNPIEKDPPKQGDPNVVYYAPGVHKPSKIDLTTGQTLYIAGGAVVKAAVTSKGDNIRIMGRGILDGTDWPHSKGPAPRMVTPQDGRNILIQDIIIRGSWNWTVAPTRCDQVIVDNIRLCGSRCGNDDGIDPCNSSNVTVKNCFLRTDDDAIAVKGLARRIEDAKASENILVEDCTFWVDYANVFRLGAESRAPGMRNFTARNIEIIHPLNPKNSNVQIFNLQPADQLAMENLVFENIRINGETPQKLLKIAPEKNNPYSRSGRAILVPGDGPCVHNVVFRNVEIYGENKALEPSGVVLLSGLTEKNNVQCIIFDNVTRYGQLLTADSPGVQIKKFVSNVLFIDPKAASQTADQPAEKPASTNPITE
jgi:hypothetical protein